MKILFLSSGKEDYLADSLLHGLRTLYGSACVDYPKVEHMYNGYLPPEGETLYGCGFTLYGGLLEDVLVDRSLIEKKIRKSFFDWVIFGNIWYQYGLFAQWRKYLEPSKTIICDGADSPQVYPYAGIWWRRPSQWFVPRAHKDFLYYKREWTPDSQFNLWHRMVPPTLRKYLPPHKNLRPISFSIPSEKIVKTLPEKTKDFAVHCVDLEVADRIQGCKTSYAFKSEAEYYADLQASRFAITTKRAGWDCLRHYEIAANGCIPCFRDLDKKPKTCAPHGLNPRNCIIYHSADNLFKQISSLTQEKEIAMRRSILDWVKRFSCRQVSSMLINQNSNNTLNETSN